MGALSSVYVLVVCKACARARVCVCVCVRAYVCSISPPLTPDTTLQFLAWEQLCRLFGTYTVEVGK